MIWMSAYAAVAILAGWLAALAAKRLQTAEIPAPNRSAGRFLLIATAGLLWPVLLLGIAQWAMIEFTAYLLRKRDSASDRTLRTALTGVTFGDVPTGLRVGRQTSNAGV